MEGMVAWPDDLAERYRRSGLWEGVTIGQTVERTARRLPSTEATE